jgi:hypothetical protein
MDNVERLARGQNAQRLMDDPIIQSALHDMEAMYINDWKTSTVDDVVKRERAFASISVLQDFKAALQSYVDTGKLAGKHLERNSKL